MDKGLKVEYIATKDLIPYENNPRRNGEAVDAVAQSIREFGFRNPIIVDKGNVIVAGHTRWYAAQKLGLQQVPVIRAADLTEEQVRAYRIADNKTTEMSSWDIDLLTRELEDVGHLFTGFTEEELTALLTPAEALVLDDDDELEDARETEICRCPKCGFEFEV